MVINFKICFQGKWRATFNLFIINQVPDKVSHFIIQTNKVWSIFKLSIYK